MTFSQLEPTEGCNACNAFSDGYKRRGKFDLFNSIEKRHLQIFCHFLTMVFESAGAVLEN